VTTLDFNAASKKGKEVKPADRFNLKTLSASLEPYRAQVEALKERALAHKVTDPKSNELAVEMGMQLKKLFKDLDDKRKDIIKPYDTITRGINKLVKPFKDTLSDAEKTLKFKIGRYQKEQAELARRIAQKKAAEEAERRRKEAEAERQAEIERQKKEREEALARQAELEEKAKAEGVEPPDVEIPEIEELPPVDIHVEVDTQDTGPTKTEEGTASNIVTWKHKLIDINKVPEEYIIKSLNGPAIKNAIKAGVREIDGLEIYEDIQVRFRTS